MNVFCLFKNRFREAMPSFVIRYSTFDTCPPLEDSAVLGLIQAIETNSLIIMKLCYFGVVSYERSRWQKNGQSDQKRNFDLVNFLKK
jgi:hypothetical protein